MGFFSDLINRRRNMATPPEPKLLTAFAPIVAERLVEAGVRGHGRIGITHLPKTERAGVWSLILPVVQMTANDMAILAGTLATFCSNQVTPVIVDGAAWYIGSIKVNPHAVQFRDNAFHILVCTLV